MSIEDHLEEVIRFLEGKREVLGDELVDAAMAPLLSRRAALGAPPEQRKVVTVLFADVSGFTSMSESLDPEDVAATMNFLWERVDKEIALRGGRVDKHLGDGVMALFGLAVSHPDDAIRAVQAGLAMHTAVQTASLQLPTAARGASLELRVGIHTGIVHAGLVPTTGEFTVMGDTVNLASRLESAAPPGGILVSRETHRHLRDRFHARRWEPLKVKGKLEPVEVFEIEAERGSAGDRNIWEVAGLRSPFVGRERELASFLAAFERVGESRASWRILLVGEPGIGKSRLLDAFAERVGRQPSPPRVLRARVRSDVTGPMGLLLDLMSGSTGVALRGLTPASRDHLSRVMDKLVPGQGRRLVADILAVVPGAAGSKEAGRRDADGAFDLRRRAFRAVGDILAGLTRRRSLVILADDLHWADNLSLDLLDHVAGLDLPVLMVSTTQPGLDDRRPEPSGTARQEILKLERMPRTAMAQLLAQLLSDIPQRPADFDERIIDAADGSPHLLEEIVRTLVERGVIHGERRRSLDLARMETVDIPTTLTTAIQARMDVLDEVSRRVVEIASVMGLAVWEAAIGEIEKIDSQSLAAVIDALVRAEILMVSSNSGFRNTRELVFRQASLREVIYEGTLRRQRRDWHASLASWMEEAAKPLETWASRIAEHWEEAKVIDHAVANHLIAGYHARGLYSLSEAEMHFQRVVDLLAEIDEPSPQRLEAFEALARTRFWQARTEDALEAAAAGIGEARRLCDRQALARGLSERTMLHLMEGDAGAALASAEEAERAAFACEDGALQARAVNDRGYSLFKQGRLGEAEAAWRSGLEASERCADATERFRALRGLTGVCNKTGRLEQARIHAEQLLALAHSEGVERWVGMVQNTLGEIQRTLGDYAAAETHYRAALAIYEKLDLNDSSLLASSNLGGALVGRGKAEEARKVLEGVVARAPERWYAIPETLHFLARGLLLLNDVDAAYARAVESVELARGARSPEDLGPALRVLGEVVARMAADGGSATAADAGRCFSESVSVLAEAELEPERARSLRAWAEHEARLGDEARARVLWNEAHSCFQRLGFTLEAARTQAEGPSAGGTGDRPEHGPLGRAPK